MKPQNKKKNPMNKKENHMSLRLLVSRKDRKPPLSPTTEAENVLAKAEVFLDCILRGAYGDIPETDHPLLQKIKKVAIAYDISQKHIEVQSAKMSEIELQARETLLHLQNVANNLRCQRQ